MALATSTLAASCTRENVAGQFHYMVKASGVNDVPGRCGGLWDNLKQFSTCTVSEIAECSDLGGGNLYWQFLVGAGCNKGMVEATWWDATTNNFGSISC